jgi:hypothetical protein
MGYGRLERGVSIMLGGNNTVDRECAKKVGLLLVLSHLERTLDAAGFDEARGRNQDDGATALRH